MKTYKRREVSVEAVQFEGRPSNWVQLMNEDTGHPGCGLVRFGETSIILQPGDWLVFGNFEGVPNNYSMTDSAFREMYNVPEEKTKD